MENFFDAS